MHISEEEAKDERTYEANVKDFISGSMGVYSSAAGFVLMCILKFYHGPYDLVGTCYKTKSTCKGIKHYSIERR